MRNISIRKMRVFVYAVEEGSFTEGARRSNISQPAAVSIIGEIEETVGEPLFERSGKTRRATLTPRGEEVYQTFIRTLGVYDCALETISANVTDDTPRTIDNEFGKFPRYMTLVPDVFAFSFEEAMQVIRRFKNNADLTQAFMTLLQTIAQADMPQEQKDELMQLIAEEQEVISYAVISRTCVVPI